MASRWSGSVAACVCRGPRSTELIRHGRLASPTALDASVAAAVDALLDQPSMRSVSTPPARRLRPAEPGIAQLSLLDGC